MGLVVYLSMRFTLWDAAISVRYEIGQNISVGFGFQLSMLFNKPAPLQFLVWKPIIEACQWDGF